MAISIDATFWGTTVWGIEWYKKYCPIQQRINFENITAVAKFIWVTDWRAFLSSLNTIYVFVANVPWPPLQPDFCCNIFQIMPIFLFAAKTGDFVWTPCSSLYRVPLVWCTLSNPYLSNRWCRGRNTEYRAVTRRAHRQTLHCTGCVSYIRSQLHPTITWGWHHLLSSGTCQPLNQSFCFDLCW